MKIIYQSRPPETILYFKDLKEGDVFIFCGTTDVYIKVGKFIIFNTIGNILREVQKGELFRRVKKYEATLTLKEV